MKVLLTGCTAQQISPAVDSRIPTFAGLLYKALLAAGAEVVWVEPHMEMDRDFVSMFDSVIVGLVSPTSLAANHMYPALCVAEAAWSQGNLSIMTDAPEPHRLWAGLVSTARNQGSLVKPFYARRRDFRAASQPDTYESLQGFVGALVSQEWPALIAPRLPWTQDFFLTRHIPLLSPSRSVGLLLDQGLEFPPGSPLVEGQERPVWVADTPESPWIRRLAATLSCPVEGLRIGRADTVVDLAERVRGALGTLVTTHRGGEPWWSPVVMLSLLQGTPVISDWRVTSVLGESWSHLAAVVEMMSPDERIALAREQLDAYVGATPDFRAEAERLVDTFVSVNPSSKK